MEEKKIPLTAIAECREKPLVARFVGRGFTFRNEGERERKCVCVCVWESSGLFDWYRENVLRGIGILDLGRPVKSHFQLSLGLLFLVALADLSHLCCVFPLLSDPFDPSSYFLFFFLLNFIVIIIKWKVETTPHPPPRSLLGVSQCHMHLHSFIKF